MYYSNHILELVQAKRRMIHLISTDYTDKSTLNKTFDPKDFFIAVAAVMAPMGLCKLKSSI